MGSETTSPPLAARIAAFATQLRYEELPAEVVHQVKRTVIDTLGCGLGGFDSEPSRIAQSFAAGIGSDRPATILGSGIETSAELAAFANDVMVRYLDWNDGFISLGSGHPSDSVAALFAAAEASRADGRALVLSVAIAFDVFCKIMDRWANKPLGIDHATIGAIASTAGAGRVMGLSEEQLTHAIGIIAASNVGLNQTRVGHVSNWKACGYANSNRNALFAVEMARRGMTGPAPVFEGTAGFFKVVSRGAFEPAPFGGRDEPFGIMRCSTKKYPLGQYAQTVVEAAIAARRHFASTDELVEIIVHTVTAGIALMADGEDKWRPPNRETADHSLPYCTAVALAHGLVETRHFESEFTADPALLDLAARVRFVPSEEADRRALEMNLCDLEIVLHSGKRHSFRVEYHRGHWLNPMSDGEMEDKFLTLAHPLLPLSRCRELLAQLWRLEDVSDIRQLMQLTRIPH